MTHFETYEPREANAAIGNAEENFLLLARSPQFYHFLGRCADASDEELRSIFGVAVAAIRRSSMADEPEYRAARQPVDSTAGLSRAALETRIREMARVLSQREDQIRDLRTRLEKAESRRRRT